MKSTFDLPEDLAPDKPVYTEAQYKRASEFFNRFEKAKKELADYLEKNKGRGTYSRIWHKQLWQKVLYHREKAYPEWLRVMNELAESLDWSLPSDETKTT